MSLTDYHYELPPELIARHPPADRDGGRLMVLSDAMAPSHRGIRELPGLLAPGDLLVVNDSRVMPARLRSRRRTGGRVELLLLEPGPGPVEALVRNARRLREGEVLEVEGGGEVVLLERREEGIWRVSTAPEPLLLMEAHGEVPLPPYLQREATAEDGVRYQTVYAGPHGAVAAPTAGLHLSDALLAELDRRGVRRAQLTLHVGIGTFRPLRDSDLERGELHEEHYELPQATVDRIARTRREGGRVIAVGTTSTRALESAARQEGGLQAGPGRTRLFIRPGDPFHVIDGLLTNFHLPDSSLMALVCAFGGRERVLAAYGEAIRRAYRFYSYGDAMLLLRAGEELRPGPTG